MRVSIFEQQENFGSENLTVNEMADAALEVFSFFVQCYQFDHPLHSQAEDQNKNVDRKDSFLMPAINFARRLSMKITGSRGENVIMHKKKISQQHDLLKLDLHRTDVNMGRKRARRTPKPISAETKPGRRLTHG